MFASLRIGVFLKIVKKVEIGGKGNVMRFSLCLKEKGLKYELVLAIPCVVPIDGTLFSLIFMTGLLPFCNEK